MVTIPYEYRQLPTAEDLPDSDETPVDNELQNDVLIRQRRPPNKKGNRKRSWQHI